MSEKKIKLVALDMDGTLLDSRKRIPADFSGWVKSHGEIQTVIASGRQYQTLYNMFSDIAEHLVYVADNGGFVFRKGKLLYSNAMKKEYILWCLKQFDGKAGIHPILCGAKAAYMKPSPGEAEDNAHMYYDSLEIVDSLEEWIEKDCIVKVAVFAENKEGEKLYRENRELPDGLASVLSGDSWVDFSNCSVSKGTAMKTIQQKINVSRDESMAFGDYLNDYELLLSCGESYAMKNAHPKLKEIAKYEADSNDEDGVMKILRML